MLAQAAINKGPARFNMHLNPLIGGILAALSAAIPVMGQNSVVRCNSESTIFDQQKGLSLV
jgi:hypothetical protein